MNFSLLLYYYVIIIIIIIIVIIIFIIVSFIIILIVTLVVYSKTENVKVSINLPVGMEYIFLFADFLSQLLDVQLFRPWTTLSQMAQMAVTWPT